MIAFEVYLFNFATRLSFLSRGTFDHDKPRRSIHEHQASPLQAARNHAYMKGIVLRVRGESWG